MRAFLLAAGSGTRLGALTETLPKCLMPILGVPLLERWLVQLTDAGFEEILVNTHYLSEVVRCYVEESKFKDKIRLIHEPELLLTGGSLLKNRNALDGQPFIAIHADNLSLFNMRDFVAAHRARPKPAVMTMMTFKTPNPSACGVVDTDPSGLLTGFYEKVANPPGNRANAAVYIFEPEIFDVLQSLGKEKIDLSTEVIPRLMGRIFTWHNADYHRDIGTPQSLILAQFEMALRQGASVGDRFLKALSESPA